PYFTGNIPFDIGYFFCLIMNQISLLIVAVIVGFIDIHQGGMVMEQSLIIHIVCICRCKGIIHMIKAVATHALGMIRGIIVIVVVRELVHIQVAWGTLPSQS